MKNLLLSLLILLGLAVNVSAKSFYAIYVEDGLIYAGIYKDSMTEEYMDILITYDYDDHGRPVNKIVRMPITSSEQRSRVHVFESLKVKESK